MAKDLERDLGLYATLTVSIGAMIGSGIFVLPGLAYKFAGPAVVVAYFLAGLIVLPAALSKAEMATAMPEAGGTYLYIDRAMGPLLGTIAGVGAWFSLVFKSSFALVGLGAYLVLFSALPPKVVALVLAVALVVVNVLGVKESGRLQALIVTLVLATLVLYIADGLMTVRTARYHPFFAGGPGGVLAATGFVFVSYAGVTKIASIAEEVENPGRNIPLAMLGSVALMMLVYTFVVFVVVGVVPAGDLTGSLTAMATGAEVLLGPFGDLLIAGVAVLALTSMANAGVLSSSRFPFAMSRDALAPPSLGRISDRFRTPVVAIGITGVLLVVLVAFVPVLELAKLASAFKILVFSLVNVALIAFRESELAAYDPEFTAPGYPWVQLAGILGGLVLLTQMGTLPLVGAVGIVAAGIAWYRLYGRERTEREGAALDAIRQSIGDQSFEHTRLTVDGGQGADVLVTVGPETTPERERALLTVAGHVAASDGGTVHAVRFEEVPPQVTLSSAADEVTPEDREFECQTAEMARGLDAPVAASEVVCHDATRAVANYSDDIDARLVLGAWTDGPLGGELLGHDVDGFMQDVEADLGFLYERDLDGLDRVAVLTQRGPHGPLQVALAGAIAAGSDATVEFVTAVAPDASDELVADTRAYHARLRDLAAAGATSTVVRSDDVAEDLAEAVAGADLALVGVDPHNALADLLLGDLSTAIADRLACSVLLVHSRMPRSILRRVIKRTVF